MTRQAWLFLGVMGSLVVMGLVGVVAIAVIFGIETDSAAGSREPSRCEPVSASKVQDIEQGLEANLALRNAQAVRSNDYEKVWMIAADIQGPGLDGSDEVAVWASNSLSSGGLIFAADAMAREFSDWGPLPDGRATDDGIREARDCAR